ncbi:MAG: polysaccharide biosynthesis protein, partial [Sphingobacteriaceae bacterium]|nr:polysaccharide biosynthesis protein [Sphingobacteriaceae bacterium]
MFSKIEIVPRWIIFCIDLVISAFSLYVAYFLYFKLDVATVTPHIYTKILTSSLIFFFVNVVVFLITKTYSGIIRYTSAQDSIRILTSVILSNVVFYF